MISKLQHPMLDAQNEKQMQLKNGLNIICYNFNELNYFLDLCSLVGYTSLKV